MAGVEGDGLESLRLGAEAGGGEDVGEPGRLVPVAVTANPAERIVLIDAAVVRLVRSDEDGGVSQGDVGVGEPEVALVAENRPPAVLDEPGTVLSRIDGETLGGEAVVPADEGDDVASPRSFFWRVVSGILDAEEGVSPLK